MGMPLKQPDSGHVRSSGTQGINWLNDVKPERVTITLETDCLCRLLGEHQLYVEDFSCVDESSITCVRKLLLTLLKPMGGDR